MEQQLGAAIPDHAAYNAAPRNSLRALTSTLNPDEVLDRILTNVDRVAPIGELCTSAPCQILIVEDNIVNQRVAQRLLHRLGYRADTALLEDRQASIDAGMDAVITKPLRVEQLVEVLRSARRRTTQNIQQGED